MNKQYTKLEHKHLDRIYKRGDDDLLNKLMGWSDPRENNNMNKTIEPIDEFLKHFTVDDVAEDTRKPHKLAVPDYGGLREWCSDTHSFVFGNRELAIYELNGEDEPDIYYVDIYGDRKILVGT